MKKIILSLYLIGYALVCNSQTVSQYQFAESLEVYTPVVGTNSTAVGNGASQNGIPIGFNFMYGGINYSMFSISANGYIHLGDYISSASSVFSYNSPQFPCIAPLWYYYGNIEGRIKYATTGTAPNRKLEVGWDTVYVDGNTSTADIVCFKIRLYEADGTIEFLYGPTTDRQASDYLEATIGIADNTTMLSVTPGPAATYSTTEGDNNIRFPEVPVGRKYIFSPPHSCANPLNPGNTISNVTQICGSTNFFLGLQNPIQGAGNTTYQWYKSTDGVNYNPMLNATKPALSTTQQVATFYKCEVSCGANTVFSNPISIGTINAAACICFPTFLYTAQFGNVISNVEITGTTLANNTGNSAIAPFNTFYTGQPNYTASLEAGVSYELKVTVVGNNSIIVWIDYNEDGIFSLNEKVTGGYAGTNNTAIHNFTIPCNITPGLKRMRILKGATFETGLPCETNHSGEAEDYLITITPYTGCNLATGLLATSVTTNSAQFQWQPGCVQTSWDFHITELGGGLPTGTPFHTDLTTPSVSISGLQPNTLYEVYVRGKCGTNGYSDWSPAYTFATSTATPVPVKYYNFSNATEDYAAVLGTVSTAQGNNGKQNNLPIGFTFVYGGQVYNSFSISTNGYIRLGRDIGPDKQYAAFSNNSTEAPVIAPAMSYNTSLMNMIPGSIKYAVFGSSPNKTLEVGWDNVYVGVKMRIHETSNKIEFIYRPMSPNEYYGGSYSIGLNDTTSFLSVTSTSLNSGVSNLYPSNDVFSLRLMGNRKFVFEPPSACVTPNPGNTLSPSAKVCANRPLRLTLQNDTPGTGVSYQWFSSTNGNSYTAIPDATKQEVVVSQAVATTYKCSVTCMGNSVDSTPVAVSMAEQVHCDFCVPNPTLGKSRGNLISKVEIEGTTLSNFSGFTNSDPNYTYFNGQPNYTATLHAGVSYPIKISAGSFAGEQVGVFIDFDNDGIFSNSEELLFTGLGGAVSSYNTAILYYQLPCDGNISGMRKMRVRTYRGLTTPQINGCDSYNEGETEDYDVTFSPSINCQPPFNIVTGEVNSTTALIGWLKACDQTLFDLHITPQGGPLPTGSPSHPEVNPVYFASGLQPSTTYDYYVRANCGVDGYGEWIGPKTFTTLPEGPINDDCVSATELTPGFTFEEHAVVGTNVNATKTLDFMTPTCAISGPGLPSFKGDVWYKVTVPNNGDLRIEVRQDPGSPFIDSGMTIYRGYCGNLTQIVCSDDEGLQSFSMVNLLELTPGETLFARVWEKGNDTFGTFQISAWTSNLQISTFDKSQLKVYPNPVNDKLNISAKENITSVEIYNVIGQKLIVKVLDATKGEIEMTALPSGTYMVKVISGNLTETFKILKQ